MKQEEFKRTTFSSKTRVEYKGELYALYSLDFEECLFAIYSVKDDCEDARWVRCENCKIVAN